LNGAASFRRRATAAMSRPGEGVDDLECRLGGYERRWVERFTLGALSDIAQHGRVPP
jgi:hypothetical protein